MTSSNTKPIQLFLFAGLGLLCLTPVISSPIALLMGFTLASIGMVPSNIDLGKWTKKLLALSIVGLGFGINLPEAIAASSGNLVLIVGSIIFTIVLGYGLTRLMGLDSKTGHLIGCGTAICGGSAIAAVSPAINAKSDQTAVALACIFLLNSVALFIFPTIGHALNLSQHDFGVWSAIAIHDTSSVVGAAGAYGDEALKIATTVKLARALWIIPVALLSAMAFGGRKSAIAIPYFIGFYCLAILFAHFVPQGQAVYSVLFDVSKQLLIVCLFLIGAAITVKKIRANGPKPLLLGVMLWVAIGTTSLGYIIYL
ncbi:YeiH family protein [Shewanella maritima]|uniref:YeiH family protein n=1 Tax=Shewanella maritima TaxID=2520507 RepID=UPI0037359855